MTAETHKSALELATGVHETVGAAAAELHALRSALEGELALLGLEVASAGTHPFAVWHETVVSSGHRYQAVYGSMRELARREPTFGLHVHVGVREPEAAVRLANSMRGHLPMLLALSANSPFWQGRDSGLASARTPLFQAFPRVGIPRAFNELPGLCVGGRPADALRGLPGAHVPVVGRAPAAALRDRSRCASWTRRRRSARPAALAALVQSIARLEVEQGYLPPAQLDAVEALDENRFLAARDGVAAELIDVDSERRMPVSELLDPLLASCASHARALGCRRELEQVRALAASPGRPARWRWRAARPSGCRASWASWRPASPRRRGSPGAAAEPDSRRAARDRQRRS